jgi:hypothetical protein
MFLPLQKRNHHQIFGNFPILPSRTMATAASTSSSPSLAKKGQDWADISDDEEETTPTVIVDTLDLTSLSLNENKDKPAPTGDSPLQSTRLIGIAAPGKSLADRISSGEMTTEVKKEDIKASTTTTTTEEKKEDKEIKESETNLIQNKYEVAVKLQDLQADPNSPLFSVKSFEELGL